VTVAASWYVAVGVLLFTLGTVTVLARRNVLFLLLGIELMFGAVALTLAAYADRHEDPGGQVFALLVLLVGFAEMMLGLAIVMARFRWSRLERPPATLARLVDTIRIRNHALSFVLGVIFILWFLVAG
jgi:NADH-quinone oxidoreductase subunit K